MGLWDELWEGRLEKKNPYDVLEVGISEKGKTEAGVRLQTKRMVFGEEEKEVSICS